MRSEIYYKQKVMQEHKPSHGVDLKYESKYDKITKITPDELGMLCL